MPKINIVFKISKENMICKLWTTHTIRTCIANMYLLTTRRSWDNVCLYSRCFVSLFHSVSLCDVIPFLDLYESFIIRRCHYPYLGDTRSTWTPFYHMNCSNHRRVNANVVSLHYKERIRFHLHILTLIDMLYATNLLFVAMERNPYSYLKIFVDN